MLSVDTTDLRKFVQTIIQEEIKAHHAKQNDRDNELLTIKQAANFANVSRNTIRNAITSKAHPLPYTGALKLIRIRRGDVLAWLEAKKAAQATTEPTEAQ